MTYIVPI